MARRLQLVILGTGNPDYERCLAEAAAFYPGQAKVLLRFDDNQSRRIYAGSDIFMMPSRYEPCGLGQLIALRYGAVPLVHATGGLADTIHDPAGAGAQANGFVFDQAQAPALLAALDRALEEFADRKRWRDLVRRGMEEDFSWGRSAVRYLELYRLAMEKCRDR